MAVPHDDQDYGASYIELEESAGVHSTSAAAPATVYSEPTPAVSLDGADYEVNYVEVDGASTA